MLGVRFFFFGCNNSFCGCNISFCSYNISFCGCNISFCGYNISFCGCNNSKSDCYILFSACSKSKRDLCFSYATTYNLVDAFLSFKVLHETDAQRFVACFQVAISAPSHYKYIQKFKFNSVVSKISQNLPLETNRC